MSEEQYKDGEERWAVSPSMIFMLLLLFSTTDIKESASMVKLVEFYDIPEKVAFESSLMEDEAMMLCLNITLQNERFLIGFI